MPIQGLPTQWLPPARSLKRAFLNSLPPAWGSKHHWCNQDESLLLKQLLGMLAGCPNVSPALCRTCWLCKMPLATSHITPTHSSLIPVQLLSCAKEEKSSNINFSPVPFFSSSTINGATSPAGMWNREWSNEASIHNLVHFHIALPKKNGAQIFC